MIRIRVLLRFLCLILAAELGMEIAVAGDLPPRAIHVDDDAPSGGDGRSWATAYQHLQDALHSARSGETIVVAGGIYAPDLDEAGNVEAGDREAAFHLVGGVDILGGFSGLSDTAFPDRRDVRQNRTILTGDLLRNDVRVSRYAYGDDFPSRAENAYHVLTCSGVDSQILLDGVEISGGHANGEDQHDGGGGLLADGCVLRIANTIFRQNFGIGGAALRFIAGEFDCDACAFETNIGGSGAYIIDSVTTIADSRFVDTLSFHGAIFVSGGTVSATACTVGPNACAGLTLSDTEATIDNSLFHANSGRAMTLFTRATASLRGCSFIGNGLSGEGAAIFGRGVPFFEAINCRFVGNVSGQSGGAVHVVGTEVSFTNCRFVANRSHQGGAVFTCFGSRFDHCVFYGNSTLRGYGGAAAGSGCGPGPPVRIANSILWDNGSSPLDIDAVEVSYSCVEGGAPGPGNFDEDPLLDAAREHLLAGSPCMDAGDPASSGSTDMDGEARDGGVAPDIGSDEWHDADTDALPDWWESAYFGAVDAAEAGTDTDGDGLSNREEYQRSRNPLRGPRSFFVSPLGDDQWDGLAPTVTESSGPKRTIQAGIMAAHPYEGDEVVVGPGIYTGVGNRNLTFMDKRLALRGSGGSDNCIIDCEGGARGLSIMAGQTENTLVSGLTIRNGAAHSGAGLFFLGVSLRLEDCVVQGCAAEAYGGGACDGGRADLVFSRCSFLDNSAKVQGGGFFSSQPGALTIEDSLFERNVAQEGGGVRGADGGGLEIRRSLFRQNRTIEQDEQTTRRASGNGAAVFWDTDAPIRLDRSSFISNHCDGYGGAAYLMTGDVTIDSCLIANNDAVVETGGIRVQDHAGARVRNCAFVGNRAPGISFGDGQGATISGTTVAGNLNGRYSGGVGASCPLVMRRSVVWGNTPEQITARDSAEVTSSCIQGGWPGDGNIEQDPLLQPDGYHLTPLSPCIDAVAFDEVVDDEIDVDGDLRRRGCGFEMGADEVSFVGIDCNDNGTTDACDLRDGVSGDCDANGVLDECDPDCNANGVSDLCEIRNGTSDDCDGDGIPAECEADCDGDGQSDTCQIATGEGSDCNLNEVLDACEGPIRFFVDDDAPAGGTGASWDSAMPSLTLALSRARRCEGGAEIRIAQGTYTPGSGRTESFPLTDGLVLRGGFAGVGEPNPALRNVREYETVLSGEIGFPGPEDNAYRVVSHFTNGGSALIDGVTIAGGNANEQHPYDRGGGVFLASSAAVLRDCRIRDNLARYGGGIYTQDGSPVLENVELRDNTASDDGGGAYVSGGAMTMIAGEWSGNSARYGGAVYLKYADFDASHGTLVDNHAVHSGGAVYSGSGSSLTAPNTRFEQNGAGRGGAVLAYGAAVHLNDAHFAGNRAERGGALELLDAQTYIQHCEFRANEAFDGLQRQGLGGAIYWHIASPLIVGATFRENTAARWGGAIAGFANDETIIVDTEFVSNSGDVGGALYVDGGGSRLTAVRFVRNRAGATGGAIFCDGVDLHALRTTLLANQAGAGGGIFAVESQILFRSSLFAGNRVEASGAAFGLTQSVVRLELSTLANNQAGSTGAGIFGVGATVHGHGSVIWNNLPTSDWIDGAFEADPEFRFSCVQGGWFGEGNLSTDPNFVREGYWDSGLLDAMPEDDVWVDGNYGLTAGSAGIDAGDPAPDVLVGEADLSGGPRILCGRIDLGAREFGFGDFDCDGEVDARDLARWPACLNGPSEAAIADDCRVADFDGDGQVTLRDFFRFQAIAPSLYDAPD